MRSLITTFVLLLAGCAGDVPSDDSRCTGKLYDHCVDEHDCVSGNCVNFTAGGGFSACSVGCTPGTDAPCMAGGKTGTCSPTSVCTPPAPNACTPH